MYCITKVTEVQRCTFEPFPMYFKFPRLYDTDPQLLTTGALFLCQDPIPKCKAEAVTRTASAHAKHLHPGSCDMASWVADRKVPTLLV